MREVRIRVRGKEEVVELETLLFQLRKACQFMQEGHPRVRLVLPSGERVEALRIERGDWYCRLIIEMDLSSLMRALSGRTFRRPYWIPIHISSQNPAGSSEFARLVREGKMAREDVWWFYTYYGGSRNWIARAVLYEEGWEIRLLR